MMPLDLQHGYCHLSTATQLPIIIERFYLNQPIVSITIEYALIQTNITWQYSNEDQTNYPHAHLKISKSAIIAIEERLS